MQSQQKASLAGDCPDPVYQLRCRTLGAVAGGREFAVSFRVFGYFLGGIVAIPLPASQGAGWSWLLPQQGSGQQQQPKLCVSVTQPFSLKTLTGLACYSSYFFLISSFNSNSALADL